MRTTLDIDEKLLEKAVRLSRARTKKGAIEEALSEYVRSQLGRRLAARIRAGELGIDLTLEQLDKLRGRD